jgi:hypothetical protein
MDPHSVTSTSSTSINVEAKPIPSPPTPEASEWSVTLRNNLQSFESISLGFRVIGLDVNRLIMQPPELNIPHNGEGRAILRLRPLNNPTDEQPFALEAWCHDQPAIRQQQQLQTVALKQETPGQDTFVVVGSLHVSVRDPGVTVKPGETRPLDIFFEKSNLQDVSVKLQLTGLPKTWSSPRRLEVAMRANESKTTTQMIFSPPDDALVGIYPLSLEVHSGDEQGTLSLFLKVKAEVSTTIAPKIFKFKPGEPTLLTWMLLIKNESAHDRTFSVHQKGLASNLFKLTDDLPDDIPVPVGPPRKVPISVTQPNQAGIYVVEIYTEDKKDKSNNFTVMAQLEVLRTGEYSVTLGKPEVNHEKRTASYELKIVNMANAPLQQLRVHLGDPSPDGLKLVPEPFNLELNLDPSPQPVTRTLTVGLEQELSATRTVNFTLVTEGSFEILGQPPANVSQPPIPTSFPWIPPDPPLSISSIPSKISLVPGQDATFKLTVANHGPDIAVVSLSVEGLSKDWNPKLAPQLSLEPGPSTVDLLIRAPDKGLCGPYQFSVLAVSGTDPSASAEVRIDLGLSGKPAINLSPSWTKDHDAQFEVHVDNTSCNAPVQVKLGAAQEGKQLVFGLAPNPIQADAGLQGSGTLTVSLKEPVKGVRTDTFTLNLVSEFLRTDNTTIKGPGESQDGSVTWRPLSHWDHSRVPHEGDAAVLDPTCDPTVYIAETADTKYKVYVYIDKDKCIRALQWDFKGDKWEYVDFHGANRVRAADSPTSYQWLMWRRQHVVYRGMDNNHLHQLELDNQSWTDEDLSCYPNIPPNIPDGRPVGLASERGNGARHIFYRGQDKHIYELWNSFIQERNDWEWGCVDHVQKTGAPKADSELSVYIWDSDPNSKNGSKHVVYRDIDNHIQDLHYLIGHPKWRTNNLSKTGNSPAAMGNPIGYALEARQGVFYRGQDDHIHELSYAANTRTWEHLDLCENLDPQNTAHAPPTPGSNLACLVGDGLRGVVYRGVDNHIHLLQYNKDSGKWDYFDLSKTAGAAAAGGDPACLIGKGLRCVVYRGVDNNIHELRWRAD